MSKNGGPAFPVPKDVLRDSTSDTTEFVSGMSLRDWFAGHAVAGIVSTVNFDNEFEPSVCAETAYSIADAMIKERAK